MQDQSLIVHVNCCYGRVIPCLPQQQPTEKANWGKAVGSRNVIHIVQTPALTKAQ